MVIVDRPRIWKNNREVKVKPWRFPKARTWSTSNGDLTLWDKRGNAVISLASGNWDKARRG